MSFGTHSLTTTSLYRDQQWRESNLTALGAPFGRPVVVKRTGGRELGPAVVQRRAGFLLGLERHPAQHCVRPRTGVATPEDEFGIAWGSEDATHAGVLHSFSYSATALVHFGRTKKV